MRAAGAGGCTITSTWNGLGEREGGGDDEVLDGLCGVTTARDGLKWHGGPGDSEDGEVLGESYDVTAAGDGLEGGVDDKDSEEGEHAGLPGICSGCWHWAQLSGVPGRLVRLRGREGWPLVSSRCPEAAEARLWREEAAEALGCRWPRGTLFPSAAHKQPSKKQWRGGITNSLFSPPPLHPGTAQQQRSCHRNR